MLREGLKAIDGPHMPTEVVRGMNRAVQQVLAEVDATGLPPGRDELSSVIATACRDQSLAEYVRDAFEQSGSDGIVTITSGLGNTTELSVSSGMQIDSGYLSDEFVNSPSGHTCSFEDCLILMTDHRIPTIQDIMPILEQVAALKKPLLLIADELGGEVLQLLQINSLKGTLHCVAIRCPGSGSSRSALLKDLAIFAGGRAVTRDLGTAVNRISTEDLGHAGEVIVGIGSTTITNGRGDGSTVRAHIEKLRANLAISKNPYESEKLHLRITNLAGKIATIHLARPTPSELEDAKYRAQAGMNSARAAIKGGYVVGGGVPLLRAIDRIRSAQWLSEAERCGADAVVPSRQAPFGALAARAGLDVGETIERVRARTATVGLNAANGAIEDLVGAGVLDPTLLIRNALDIAFSQVKTLLLTDSWDKRDLLTSEMPAFASNVFDLAENT